MPKYKVTYKIKMTTSKTGEVNEHRLVTGGRTVRANSFKEARDKVRRSSGYEVVDIHVEVKQSWLKKLLRRK